MRFTALNAWGLVATVMLLLDMSRRLSPTGIGISLAAGVALGIPLSFMTTKAAYRHLVLGQSSWLLGPMPGGRWGCRCAILLGTTASIVLFYLIAPQWIAAANVFRGIAIAAMSAFITITVPLGISVRRMERMRGSRVIWGDAGLSFESTQGIETPSQ